MLFAVFLFDIFSFFLLQSYLYNHSSIDMHGRYVEIEKTKETNAMPTCKKVNGEMHMVFRYISSTYFMTGIEWKY